MVKTFWVALDKIIHTELFEEALAKAKKEKLFMDQIKVGEFLASLRKEKGLTQEALAERIGVTNKTISRWETGTYMPDIEMLLILGEQFDVTVNELLCGERLSDEAIRNKSESNIKYLAETSKKRVKKVFFIAMVVVLCVSFL